MDNQKFKELIDNFPDVTEEAHFGCEIMGRLDLVDIEIYKNPYIYMFDAVIIFDLGSPEGSRASCVCSSLDLIDIDSSDSEYLSDIQNAAIRTLIESQIEEL